VTSRIGSSDQNLSITRDGSASTGGYAIRLEGAEVEMTCSREDERTMIIDHTSVPDALRGRCPGEVLVHRGVQTLARKVARSSRCVRSPRGRSPATWNGGTSSPIDHQRPLRMS
jgi:predicted GNAT family acetyltransferase